MHASRILSAVLLLAVTGCTTMQGDRPAMAGRQRDCGAAVPATQSAAGREWLAANGWRYATPVDAQNAYKQLIEGASPWPDWYVPYQTSLTPGTRFQMAIGGTQSPETPGRFGTFDRIFHVEDVRMLLAVRKEWKPLIDRVVTYEVTQPLPVKIGPVGPQIDPGTCQLLPGRGSQFQMLVDPKTIMTFIKVVDVQPVK
jgi:hypothetical protein